MGVGTFIISVGTDESGNEINITNLLKLASQDTIIVILH